MRFRETLSMMGARSSSSIGLIAAAMASTAQPVLAAPPQSPVGQTAQRLSMQVRADHPRPRIIVTSDVEIDDVASWHRFWLYANEYDIEGLVYSSSVFHWAGDAAAGLPRHDWAGNDVIEQMIDGFGKFGAGGGYKAVYRNLQRHDPRYPTPEELRTKIRLGNITNVGEMASNTPGSDLIRDALLGNKPGTLHLLAWGGTNTIAAALRSIEERYRGTPEWNKVRDRIVRQTQVYIILDQDKTYKDYIAPHWPDLKIIYNRDMFWSVAYQSFRNTRTPPAIDRAFFSAAFMKQIAQGPMLATYPLIRAGQTPPDQPPSEPESWVSEGDSPSYWFLLPTGLRSDEDPSFGGWGGRFEKVSDNLWTDVPDALGLPGAPVRDTVANATTEALARSAPQTRWIPAIQNDFLARARWTTLPPDATNHPPVVRVTRRDGTRSAKPGETVSLSFQAADPDGDTLQSRWWQYREAGSYAGDVPIVPARNDTASTKASINIPRDAKTGDTIHIIADVTDTGEPALTRYARFVITVR